jgi:multiple antibiotic resistance protein
MDLEFVKRAFITLFVAVDPPGLAAIFLALTAHMGMVDRKATAYRAVIIAFLILLGVSLCGRAVLESLGIGFPAFRIAGGLLLFYIGFEMVFERREQRKNHSAESAVAHDHPRNIAACPLAIPLMAGPGAITATILQSSISHTWTNYMALVTILVVVMLSCLVVFLLAMPISRILGTTGRVVLSRLLGLLLAALAVQSVGDGIVAFSAMQHGL